MKPNPPLKTSQSLPRAEDLTPGLAALLKEIGGMSRFAFRFFYHLFKPPLEWQEFLRQCYWVGYKSLGLVAVTNLIMGLVFTLQSRPTLLQFGAEAWLPSMITVSVIREIGPVLTALICAGKIGSGIGAELGSMRVTEQIDAMEVSGTNPFKFIVTTRMLATTLMLPVLVVIGSAIAIFGSFVGINMVSTISLSLFFNQAFANLMYYDVLPTVAKSFLFGFAIGLVGCYKGYYSDKGTEGVGRSSNTAVVVASLLVFVIDLLAVQVTTIIYDL